MKKILILLMLVLQYSLAVNAQNNFGLWTNAGMKKKVSRKLSINTNVELRTRNSLKTLDRVSIQGGMSYNLFKFIKLGGDYSFISSSSIIDVTSKGNIIPSYWYNRHRVGLSATTQLKIDRLNISLREKWQYTYRPEKYVPKYKSDGVTRKDDELIEGRGKNELRSRLQMDYDVFKSCFKPYVSAEIYNTKGGIEKTRYTAGTTLKLNKNNEFDLFYRYQNYNNKDDDEFSKHVLGIGYNFKF